VKGLFDILQKDIVLYCIQIRSRITLIMIFYEKSHLGQDAGKVPATRWAELPSWRNRLDTIT